jgi:hypothetical protein
VLHPFFWKVFLSDAFLLNCLDLTQFYLANHCRKDGLFFSLCQMMFWLSKELEIYVTLFPVYQMTLFYLVASSPARVEIAVGCCSRCPLYI